MCKLSHQQAIIAIFIMQYQTTRTHRSHQQIIPHPKGVSGKPLPDPASRKLLPPALENPCQKNISAETMCPCCLFGSLLVTYIGVAHARDKPSKVCTRSEGSLLSSHFICLKVLTTWRLVSNVYYVKLLSYFIVYSFLTGWNMEWEFVRWQQGVIVSLMAVSEWIFYRTTFSFN